MKYPLKLLKEKISHNLDYQFIDSIKESFPTNNAYFLACLAESIYNYEDYENDDVLNDVIYKAYKLYTNSDISSYLGELKNETC